MNQMSTETTFSEMKREAMERTRELVERDEYPTDLAHKVLAIAACDPVPVGILSMVCGFDMHQAAFRERMKVTEVPGALESQRYTISAADAVCLLLQYGPPVFAKVFGELVASDARLRRTFADLVGIPELRPGPMEVK